MIRETWKCTPFRIWNSCLKEEGEEEDIILGSVVLIQWQSNVLRLVTAAAMWMDHTAMGVGWGGSSTPKAFFSGWVIFQCQNTPVSVSQGSY